MNLSSSSIFNSEIHDLRRILIKIAIFSLPFALAAIFIVFTDPYNFLRERSAISDSIKAPIANELNPPLWKLVKFDRDPKAHILLGDSRMAPLKVDVIKQVSGEDYANLGYGGASIREAIDTFWIVSPRTKLRRVFIGINPEKFNDYEITNRVEFYKNVRENPALYFVNRAVWEAAFYDVRGYFAGETTKLGEVKTTKEEFWKYDLEATQKYYDKFAEPVKYRAELKLIAEYCDKNQIELNFIIFPTHTDAQALLKPSKIAEHNKRMREDLTALAPVFDFDFENELTKNAENFTDPVHITEEIQKVVINEIWTKDLKYGKLLPRR